MTWCKEVHKNRQGSIEMWNKTCVLKFNFMGETKKLKKVVGSSQWCTSKKKYFWQLLFSAKTTALSLLVLKKVVCDWNQVSVLGTETKAQFRYRYRSHFFWNRNFFLDFFLSSFNFFLYLMFGRKFGFRGPFVIEKLTPTFKMWLLYWPKVHICHFRFQFWYWT